MITAAVTPLRLTLSCGLLLALAAGGCASTRLGSNAPEGVNLSGEWVLNASLSDDSDALDALDKDNAKKMKKKGQQPAGEGSGDAAADIASSTAVNTVPQRLSIKQDGPRFHIESGNPPEPKEYTTSAQASCGTGDARCAAGWRGPVFVVDSQPAGQKAREETYALDSEGHLILTIQAGNVFAKLAYDRDRPRT
jgi:hypothetical protein